jgi:hypothetical protein
MTIASQIKRKVFIGKQSALGTIAGTGDGKTYNYRDGGLSGGLTKEAFDSNTIRTDQQRQNASHGTRSVTKTIDQEFQIGGHTALLEGALRDTFETGATTGAVTSIGINGSTRTISRSSGSFITDGFKVGDIVRATGFAASANNNKNYRLATVGASSMTYVADAWIGTVTTESAGATVTISVPGKKLSVPSSGHTNDYFTIEEWNDDIEQSERDIDCKISSMAISIPANGNATINFGFLGRNATYATSQYFSNPTAAPNGEILAGPTGLLSYNGVDSVVLTSVDLSLDAGAEVKSVVGSNLSPDVFTGSVVVTGSMSALFEDGTILDDFDDEVEAPLSIYLFENSNADSDFVIIKLPNIKVNSADKSADGTAISLASNFSAGVLADGSTTKEQTTIVIVDSSLS